MYKLIVLRCSILCIQFAGAMGILLLSVVCELMYVMWSDALFFYKVELCIFYNMFYLMVLMILLIFILLCYMKNAEYG